MLGPRAGVTAAADRLRAAGYAVHTLDLYRGEARFDAYDPAIAYQDTLGIGICCGALQPASRPCRSDSSTWGSRQEERRQSGWQSLARARWPVSCCMPHCRPLGLDTGPVGVPVQVHFMRNDPFVNVYVKRLFN